MTSDSRRTRRLLLAALGLIVVVAAAAVVILLLDDDDEKTATSSRSDTATSPGSSEGPATAGATPRPSEPELLDVTPRPILAPSEWATEGDESSAPQWLLPWREGFLALRAVRQTTPFPELSEAESALFPIEIRELFQANPPQTVEEATEMVIQSGLAEEVSAILADHPDLDRKIRGNPSAPIHEAWVLSDGRSWTPVPEADFPFDAYPTLLASDGQHLLAVLAETDPRTGEPQEQTVFVTADLISWQRWTLESPDTAGAPAGTTQFVFPTAIDMNEAGWTMAVGAQTYLDPEALIASVEPDFEMRGGIIRAEPAGLVVDSDGPDRTFTWEELGIDEATYQQLAAGRLESTLMTAEWESAPEMVSGPPPIVTDLVVDQAGLPATVALINEDPDGDGDPAPELVGSDDGSTWTDIAAPSAAVPIWDLAEVEGGILAIGRGIWLWSAPTQWQEIRVSGLPEQLFTSDSQGLSLSPGLAIVADIADYGSTTSVEPGDADPAPAYAVVASLDGRKWLIDELDIDPDSEEFSTSGAVLNGNRLLVHHGDEVLLYDLA